jgi:hypothetical protein
MRWILLATVVVNVVNVIMMVRIHRQFDDLERSLERLLQR